MKAPQTHFEQVPLETVKKLADFEIVEKEKIGKVEPNEPGIPKKDKR